MARIREVRVLQIAKPRRRQPWGPRGSRDWSSGGCRSRRLQKASLLASHPADLSIDLMDDFVKRVHELRIGPTYQLLRRLGSGTFGKVYLGRDVSTGADVAIKLESRAIVPSLLEEEVDIYRSLAGQSGFPQVYWHGYQDDFNVMVFELLGPNLEDLFQYCGNRFSLKTTLMLADQLLHRFESLHSQDYLHRDIKPENFLLGVGRQGNIVYMTDLGLAIYRQPEYRSSSSASVSDPRLIGTCRYASINGHFGIAQSCCDDLEALGYMLIYFLRGDLPWQGLKAANREARYRLVSEMKQRISITELCVDLPTEFADYMRYLRSLRDRDQPDYGYLRKMFNSLFRRQKFEYDRVFDWTILEFQRRKVAST